LADRLAAHDWRGELVGPHGAGKSTLLHDLLIEAERRNIRVVRSRLADDTGSARLAGDLAKSFLQRLHRRQPVVLAVDSAERLGRIGWLALRMATRAARIGLLVTGHAQRHHGVLVAVKPRLGQVEQLAERLAGPQASAYRNLVPDLLKKHDGNVREVLFALYDRYEDSTAPR